MSVFNAVRYVDKALKVLSVTEGVLRMTDADDAPDAPEHEIQQEEQEMSEDQEKRTIIEEIEIEGRNLVERVKELIQEGNVRRLIIKDGSGKYLLEIPLTVGVVAGGVFALAAPVTAALGAVAGLLANVKVEVVREEEADDESSEPDA